MKKILLLASAFLCCAYSGAQTLLTEDASALAVGDIGTDLTGTTPGQGGWLTLVTSGNTSDFQVVNAGGPYGNVIQITGSNTAANSRRMYKDVASLWGTRGAGNDVAQVQFDFYTGPATTSANSMRVLLYNSDLTRMLGGFTYITATRELRGLGYYDNTAGGGAVGNYSFTLGFNGTTYSAVTLNADTWYTLGFSFNKTTGQIVFKELSGTLITAPAIMGAATGTDVSTLNLIANAISTSGQANTVSAVGKFDNLNFRALPADSPLLRVSAPIAASDISIYPNPVQDKINVVTEGTISSITIADMNGRIVKKVVHEDAVETALDVSDLTAGIYLMTVEGSSGSATRKIVKQ